MIFILIGALLVAISAAALITLPFRLTRRKTPKGLPPLAAGIALVAFVVWNDYSWYGRTAGELPEQVAIVDSLDYQGPLQPWTYIVPRTNRFTAVDRSAIRRNEQLPGYAMFDLIFVQRYEPTLQTRQIVDCQGGRRADLTNETTYADDGMPQNVVWVSLEENDPLLEIVCGSDGA
ncbi:hypothetical protein [Pararhizobium haloflavum]|uniref:hypothetical protein n=1 Tax=Pararhizobium haloflavum TaxID=2037914 RepID=UPI000C17EC2E|nr:hypothetical protein [Pararhizobium haloflavum]